MKKQLVAVLLLLSLALTYGFGAYAQTTSEKEAVYNGAIRELEVYLENMQDDSAQLAAIADAMSSLGGFRQSNFLRYYVLCLKLIAEENYRTELNIYLDVLQSDKGFANYLEQSDISLGTVEQLQQYAAARKLEAEGDISGAARKYLACGNFFDASERYIAMSGAQNNAVFEQGMALLREEDLEGAYRAFQSIAGYGDSAIMMAAIVRQLGYTPGDQPEETKTADQPQETKEPTPENDLPELTLNAKTSGNSMIVLQWNEIQGAVSYTVKRHITGKEYQPLTTVTETNYNDRKVSRGVRYYYQVAAKMSDGKTVVSNEKMIVIGNAASQTATPNPQFSDIVLPPKQSTPTPVPPPVIIPSITEAPIVTASPNPQYDQISLPVWEDDDGSNWDDDFNW